MTDGPILDDGGFSSFAESPQDFTDVVPEGGFTPESYPQLTVAPIPYTSSAQDRADPYITVTQAGWLFIEVGNTRIALPDREEWDKLVGMVDRMWNTSEANQTQTDRAASFEFGEFQIGQNNAPTSTPPSGVPDEGEHHDPDPTH